MNEPPLDRHLSTVGIGAVFLTQPPEGTLASHYCSTTTAAGPSASGQVAAAAPADDIAVAAVSGGKEERIFFTHEFVGGIKSTPSDFIVREIGGLPRSLCCPDPKSGQEGAGEGETTGGEEETEGAGGESTDNNDDNGDNKDAKMSLVTTADGGDKNGPADSETHRDRDRDRDNTMRAAQPDQAPAPEAEADQAVTPAPSTAARLYPAVRVADITDTETLPVRPNVASRMASSANTDNACIHGEGGGGAGYNGTVSLPRVNIGITNGERASKRPRLGQDGKGGGGGAKADNHEDGNNNDDDKNTMMLAGMPHDVFITSKASASALASAYVMPGGPTGHAGAGAGVGQNQNQEMSQQAEVAAAANAIANPSATNNKNPKLVKIIDPAATACSATATGAEGGEGSNGAAGAAIAAGAAGAASAASAAGASPKRSASFDTTNSEAAPLSSHLSPFEILELILIESGIKSTPAYDGQTVLAQLKTLNEEGRAQLAPPPPVVPEVPQEPPPAENADDADEANDGQEQQLHLISDNESKSKAPAPVPSAASPPAPAVEPQRVEDCVDDDNNDDDNNDDDNGNANKTVWIPYIANDIAIVDPDYGIVGTGSRGTFHRSLKTVFPMLKSTTLSEKDSLERSNKLLGDGKKKKTKKKNTLDDSGGEILKDQTKKQRWVRVEVDHSFIPLVPLLLLPKRDLLKLYQFRNRGCIVIEPSSSQSGPGGEGGDGYGGKRGSSKHRGRNHRSHHHDRGSNGYPADQAPPETQTALRLKPELDKEKRREIHTLISSKCRDFETSTIIGDDGACTIAVRWSKQANRIAIRKRKRIGGGGGGGDPNSKGMIERSYVEKSYSTLCVMKKRQVEHLSAINNIVSVLRCRQSDVGLAGIKDMLGVTYQFCTLRNVNPRRARDANKKLRAKGMELGNFERVDFALNQGDLLGNKFELIVRDIKSVILHIGSDGKVLEEFAHCQPHQIEERVKSLRRTGFVNFYGEQRVGLAGDELTIGVRPFDIGRAMLQNDFSKAIDLLMRGRIKGRGDDFVETEEIRKARALWKETGGSNPSAVLKAIPRGFLDRERSVLKGLKRYGIDQPLAALRCLHHGVRMFYINSYQSFCWNKMATERIKRLGPQPVVGDLYQEDGQSRDVKVVTDPSKVTLGMIVLPLPGYDVEYPTNQIGDLYRSMLATDGVEFKKDAVPEATARGAYRNLVAPANNLEVTFLDTRENESVGNARFTFELQSGSYATMLLRELMCTTMSR